MVGLLEPKEIEVSEPSGASPHKFIISKFPAFDGREICTQYPLSALPKLGDYKVNEEIVLKMMNYVAVPMKAGEPLRLSTRELVNNHVKSWEVLAVLELQLMQYNCSFFLEGKASIFLKELGSKLHPWITSILTASLAQLSQAVKPPSTN